MVKVYSVEWCGPCNKVKKYLETKGIAYEVITVADAKEAYEKGLILAYAASIDSLADVTKIVESYGKEIGVDMIISTNFLNKLIYNRIATH